MPGKYLRGALLSFTESFPLPVPNLILFQYNPEQLSHDWSPAGVTATSQGRGGNPLALSGLPGERFSFTLHMDAQDMIADDGPIGEGLATLSGVGTRIAALEMLLFPTAAPGKGLLGSVSAALSLGGVSAGGKAAKAPVPANIAPIVLFVWGPGRILPVRVSALSFTETLYDAAILVPIHAQAQVTLEVLTRQQVDALEQGTLAGVARTAYTYTGKVREALALLNLGNAVGSVAGMLPI